MHDRRGIALLQIHTTQDTRNPLRIPADSYLQYNSAEYNYCNTGIAPHREVKIIYGANGGMIQNEIPSDVSFILFRSFKGGSKERRTAEFGFVRVAARWTLY